MTEDIKAKPVVKPVEVKKPVEVPKKAVGGGQTNPFAVSVDASKVEGTKKKTNFHGSPLLAFDGYFEILKSENPKIKEHHREPIKKFVTESGVSTDTKENFDKIMLKY